MKRVTTVMMSRLNRSKVGVAAAVVNGTDPACEGVLANLEGCRTAMVIFKVGMATSV